MKVTIKKKSPSQKPITFTKGGLHESTNTPSCDKIPDAKKEAALEGDYGPKAKRQAIFAKNILTGRK